MGSGNPSPSWLPSPRVSASRGWDPRGADARRVPLFTWNASFFSPNPLSRSILPPYFIHVSTRFARKGAGKAGISSRCRGSCFCDGRNETPGRPARVKNQPICCHANALGSYRKHPTASRLFGCSFFFFLCICSIVPGELKKKTLALFP